MEGCSLLSDFFIFSLLIFSSKSIFDFYLDVRKCREMQEQDRIEISVCVHLNSPYISNPKAARNPPCIAAARAGRESRKLQVGRKRFYFFSFSLCWKGNALEQNGAKSGTACDTIVSSWTSLLLTLFCSTMK